MRGKGQGTLALVLVGLVVAGALAASRRGPAAATSAPPPTARSNEWLCPHGGGEGWTATISLANPGAAPVDARLTFLGSDAPAPPITLTVPAGAEVRREVPDLAADSATYVEVFGGWASAGWLLEGTSEQIGAGAEPCAPAGERTWFTTASATERGQHSSLVVMNPYAVGAVFDVTLFQPDTAPYRDPDWTDVELKPGRSVALRIDEKVPGNDVVGAEVDVSTGRVGVATLDVTEGEGISSTLGAPAAASWVLGTAMGSGQTSVLVLAPDQDTADVAATVLRSDAGPGPVDGLDGATQTGQSVAAYPLVVAGPSGLEVRASDPPPLVTALRAEGQSDDDATGGGVAEPADGWIVPPTVAQDPAFPGLVVVNPGQTAVDLTARLLGRGGPGPETELTVPARSAAAIPRAFLNRDPKASVLVLASEPVVAVGASTSGGNRGLSLYAIAAGVPIPAWAREGIA